MHLKPADEVAIDALLNPLRGGVDIDGRKGRSLIRLAARSNHQPFQTPARDNRLCVIFLETSY